MAHPDWAAPQQEGGWGTAFPTPKARSPAWRPHTEKAHTSPGGGPFIGEGY